MGDNAPNVGEIVAYYTPENGTPILANVVEVVFWDVVDLEIADGVIVRGVRRVVELAGGEVIAYLGRFARLPR